MRSVERKDGGGGCAIFGGGLGRSSEEVEEVKGLDPSDSPRLRRPVRSGTAGGAPRDCFLFSASAGRGGRGFLAERGEVVGAVEEERGLGVGRGLL